MKRRLALSLTSMVVLAVTGLVLPASSATPSRKAEVALARKALIVRSDFPQGWTTSSNGGNANKNLGVPQMLACLGMPASLVNFNPPEANSPTFNSNSLGMSVDDAVDVFPSLHVAAELFNVYGSPNSAKCVAHALDTPSVKAVFAKQLGSGAVVGNATVTNLPKPVAGNKSNALEFRIPFTYKGVRVVLVSRDVIIMSKSGTVGAQLVFTNPSQSPIAPSLIKHLELVTVQRLG